MCISRQIVQNMFRTSEGWFGVDHPVFSVHCFKPTDQSNEWKS
jgi:hypothetical protein